MENTAAREEWNVAYAIRDEELAETKRWRDKTCYISVSVNGGLVIRCKPHL
jgi:hypothetical protein